MSGPADDPVQRLEREEFARGHIEPGQEPVTPRPAATVVLARDAASGPHEGGHAVRASARAGGSRGFEVLLLRRPDSVRFAAGAYVFPGGVIDAADGDPALLERLPAAHRDREPTALAAGLRELFEETGILLADRAPPPEQAARAREALLADRSDFAREAARLDLTFHRLKAAYFARWVTPEKLTRRYDARFFLTRAHDAEPDLTPEHTEATWIPPARAVAGFRDGSFPMLFPTWKTLEVLARFGDLPEALDRLSRREVRPILARLEVRGDRIVPSMPPDPLYDGGT